MNKKVTALIAIVICALCCGCTSNVVQEVSAPEPVSVAESENEPEVPSEPASEPEISEPDYLVIGKDEENAFKVLLTNSTGKTITGIAVKSSDEEEYPENLMPEGVEISEGETFELYYTPAEATPQSLEADAVAMNVLYDIKLICGDDCSLVLYDLGISDIGEAEVFFEDEVVFVRYDSIADGQTVDTKAAQLAVKTKMEEEDAAKKAAADNAKKSNNNNNNNNNRPQPKANQDEGDCDPGDVLWN